MLTTLRTIRAFTIKDSGDRIRALREQAARQPRGTATYVLAVALWEEGQIEEAHELAMSFLQENPTDFRMLVICLDRHLRAKDDAAALEFARRVAAATRIRIFRPVAMAIVILLFPDKWVSREFRRRLSAKSHVDPLDEWARYARDYVELHSRTREE